MTEGRNPWSGPRPGAEGGTSPYVVTAFDVLDVPVTPLSRRDFLTRVRRRVNRARSGAVRVAGRPITEPEVRAAERTLLDPAGRLAQRLLAHRPYPRRLDVADLSARLDGLPPDPPRPDGPLLDRAALAALLPDAPDARNAPVAREEKRDD